MKKILISILNFNGKENTIACLRSLEELALDGISLQVVVIDNGSKEPLAKEVVKMTGVRCELIHNDTNLGFAGGHNIALKRALDLDYVVILNNDTYVDRNLIKELIAAAETDEKIAIVSPKIYFAPGSEFHKDKYTKGEAGKVIWYAGGEMDWGNVVGHHTGVDEVDRGQFDTATETEFATGCCMLLKTSVLKKSGFFDDRYFLYYEDADLQERIRHLGFKIFYAPRGMVWHKNAGSSGGSGSVLQDYYISRNRLLFGYLYAPLKTKFALLRESVRHMLGGRKWQKRGVMDFYLQKFGKGSYTPGV